MRIGSGGNQTERLRRRPRGVVTSVVAVLAALGLATPVVAGSVSGSTANEGGNGSSEAKQADAGESGASENTAGAPVPKVEGAAARQAAEPMPLQELTAADGDGRLYTLDLAEARAAAGDSQMTRTPRQVAFLPRGEFEGSTPMVRMNRTKDADGSLYTTNDHERERLLDAGWVDQGVVGHLATEPGKGRERLLRFTDGDEWRLALESRRSELTEAGYQVDGSLGYAFSQHVRAGALYFGMFNDVGGEGVIAGTEQYYGREGDWWGGVRDFRDGTDYATDNWPDSDFSHLKPSIGYYDDSDPATVEKHITQATSSGLSFFDFYWYWDAENKEEAVARKGLDAFLAADNRETIDFSIGVCAHPWGGLGIPTDQFGDVSKVLVDKYLSQDNTLRTNDGRKILTICDSRGIGDGSPEQVAQFGQTVRDRAQSELGEPIYVMINQGSLDPAQVPAAGGDASYCSTDGPAVESESYQRYLEGQRANYAAAKGPYGRCVMSNFDERPRYPINIGNLDEIRWMPDQSLDGYRQALQAVVTDMNSSERPPEVDNMVFLYAWNEWHEGGVLEPNAAEGCAYLDATREELALKGGAGCVANPDG